jgi:hypothetical protein
LDLSAESSIVTFTANREAQYGLGTTTSTDLLTVYAEAFDRDANPDDFSLESVIAHERGHQLLYRHSRIARFANRISPGSEEILASILGSLICPSEVDSDSLLSKALVELMRYEPDGEAAVKRIHALKEMLEQLL